VRILALGGYGKTALPAVELLAKTDLIKSITIAGRNGKQAQEAALKLGSKVTFLQIDGTISDQIASHLHNYDIVMNVAYNNTVLPVIEACIKTGTHYCDVAAGDVLDAATNLSHKAQQAGITAVIATGISPCISNLIAVHVAQKLDVIEQFQIGRADIFNFNNGHELTPDQWQDDPNESLHSLQEFKPFLTWMLQRMHENGCKSIRVFHRDGWHDVDPLINGVQIPYPQGKWQTVYPYLSASDIWGQLPRDQSSKTSIELAFSPFPTQLDKLLRKHTAQVVNGEIKAETAITKLFDTIADNPQHWLTLSQGYAPPLKLWVKAVGMKNKKAACSFGWFTPDMWHVGGYYLTSLALATAVLKILKGEVHQSGVLEAEKVFEPQNFLNSIQALIPELSSEMDIIDTTFEWLQ
jgi:hypothetical protein